MPVRHQAWAIVLIFALAVASAQGLYSISENALAAPSTAEPVALVSLSVQPGPTQAPNPAPATLVSPGTSEPQIPWWAVLVNAWPFNIFLLVVTVALLLIYTRLGGLVGLFARRVRKFKIPGIEFEIEIEPEAAKEIRGFFKENLDELVRKAKDQFDSKARAQLIRAKMQEIIRTSLRQRLGRQIGEHELRATVHVPDIIFARYLYQLIDYYPPGETGRAGRRFSQRFGIIGRAWRLGESIGRGSALQSDPAGRRKLIEEYGMFDDEANATSHARPSYLCVMLKNANAARGILFIDSTRDQYFGTDAQADILAKALEQDPTVITLSNSVGAILEELSEAGPSLDIEL